MRLTIRHETRYTYAEPATHAIQCLRLTPRSHDGQFVRSWRLSVGADAKLEKREDGFGNIVHTVFAEGPLDELIITAEGEVDTDDRFGIAAGTIERQPPGVFLSPTRLTMPTPEIDAFALAARDRNHGEPLATLHDLMAAIKSTMEFQPGMTSSATTAGEAFAARTGVCQDFAHVFLAACRRLGVPGRYVAGHYLRTDGPEQTAGHAWAEAYIDVIGWVGFDPANDTCATERHVRIAVGRDGLDAAPVRGARTGGGEETLTVAVQVAERRPPDLIAPLPVLPELPDPIQPVQSQSQSQSQ
jgi:transglutaminase-like putative cysteine protease